MVREHKVFAQKAPSACLPAFLPSSRLAILLPTTQSAIFSIARLCHRDHHRLGCASRIHDQKIIFVIGDALLLTSPAGISPLFGVPASRMSSVNTSIPRKIQGLSRIYPAPSNSSLSNFVSFRSSSIISCQIFLHYLSEIDIFSDKVIDLQSPRLLTARIRELSGSLLLLLRPLFI